VALDAGSFHHRGRQHQAQRFQLSQERQLLLGRQRVQRQRGDAVEQRIKVVDRCQGLLRFIRDHAPTLSSGTDIDDLAAHRLAVQTGSRRVAS